MQKQLDIYMQKPNKNKRNNNKTVSATVTTTFDPFLALFANIKSKWIMSLNKT